MVEINKVSYNGWSNCIKISNNLVELVILSDVGPRIIHYGFKGGENQFYENPDDSGQTGGDQWRGYGGHRLWHSPEDVNRTFYPDNNPVDVQILEDGAIFTAKTEPNGIQKVIEIHLADNETKVTVDHTLINHGPWPVPLGVWAVSVMKSGGKVIVPHPRRFTHDELCLPTHTMSLWGYTKMDDPRWVWGEKYYSLKQDPKSTTCQKIGSMNTYGWAAYQRGEFVFIKKFSYIPGATYPDFNCNFETYSDPSILEVETLAPMVLLETGQKDTHQEEWWLHKGIKPATTDAEIDALILPLVK